MRKTMASLVTISALILAGCAGGGGSGGGKGDPIVIGAVVPLTGAFAGFGPLIQNGYEDAVAQVNADGGIELDGVVHPIELIVRDSKSDATVAGEIARNLVLEDEAVGLLGSVSPPNTVPVSNVADREKIPMITGLTPVRAWLAANESGWKYAWDVFFIEDQMTKTQFSTADLTDTNKKVALFTDTGEDGVLMGKLWEENAPKSGYEVVSHASFPIGTTEYTSFINEARAAKAEVVITQMSPPDSFALWKQMKALGYVPEVAICEKCGATSAFQKSLGDVAEGTLSTNYWNAGSHEKNEDAQRLLKAFPDVGQNGDMSALVTAQSVAAVMLDAIKAAGSTDPEAINTAIGKTDGDYAVGPIDFNDEHYSLIEAFHGQWRGNRMVPVDPKWPGAEKIAAPVGGLK